MLVRNDMYLANIFNEWKWESYSFFVLNIHIMRYIGFVFNF